MPFKDHFSSIAPHYAAYRPTYPPALGAYLAALPARRELALDCGCGCGQLSVGLAEAFTRVVATDASARQIAHARRNPSIEYRQSPAERMDLADASVDLITAAQAAHWFALEPFYAEAARVLRADGALALITYGVLELDGPAGEVLSRFTRETIGPFWPPERRHIESGYRTLPFPFPEEPSPRMTMTARWTLAWLLGYVGTWSATQIAARALGDEPIERLRSTLAAVWGRPELAREVRWPLSLRVGRVAADHASRGPGPRHSAREQF